MKQNKIFLSLVSVFISLSVIFSTVFAEPPNLSLVRQEIIAYYKQGDYDKDLSKVIANARSYIDKRAAEARSDHEKLAIVLDIDETSLSNVKRIIQENFSADPKKIEEGILAANSPAIKPMLSLYNDAKKQGLAVFFVTGRQKTLKTATKTNLLRAGYKNWSGLYFRPDVYKFGTIVKFKAAMRRLIEEKGYKIIASIGDQQSDLVGGYAEKGFKLPNPFYYLP